MIRWIRAAQAALIVSVAGFYLSMKSLLADTMVFTSFDYFLAFVCLPEPDEAWQCPCGR